MAWCVAGAIPEIGVAALLNCSQGGLWTSTPGSGCICDSGLLISQDRRSCGACPIGMYLSVMNRVRECRVCPANSMGITSGLSVCACEDGYYRLAGEEDLPCTQPPSEPRNLVIISIMPTTLTLTWDPPEYLGGRTDTMYTLWYQEEGSSVRVNAVAVNTTVGSITGLRAGSQYIVSVSAENGVSHFAAPSNHTVRLRLVTTNTGTRGISGTVISVIISVLVIALTTVIVIFFYFKRKMKKIRSNDTGDNHMYETVSNCPPQNSSPVVPLAENVSSGQQSLKLEDNVAYEKSQVELGSETRAAQNHLQLTEDVSYEEPEVGVVLKDNVAYMKLRPAFPVHRGESEHEVTGIGDEDYYYVN